MNAMRNFVKRGYLTGTGRIPMALLLAIAIGLAGFSAQAKEDHDWEARGANACVKTSRAALNACYTSAQENLWLDIGKCNNVAREDKGECLEEARSDMRDAVSECREVFEARREVCDAVGPGPYLPAGIDPDDFADNPLGNDYFPLIPGTQYTYKLFSGDDILETIVVEVKDETREIEGVECRVVQDTVYDGDSEDVKIEDTTDWYALDNDGDVWYFGEIALNFEDGIVSDIDGSWTAGVEGAKPGINMFSNPGGFIGRTYRQEFALGEAEDLATIVEILELDEFKEQVLGGEPVPAVFGDGPFLHTRDFSPFEPGVVEHKYYGSGVGNVLIVKPATDTDPVQMEVLVNKIEL